MATGFHLIPENPLPEGARAGLLRAADGVGIRYATFPPARSEGQKGVLVILSGRNETIEKYFESIADFCARGFLVVALDWRGQGGSDRLLADPARGYVRSFDDYVADLDMLFRDVIGPLAPHPVYMLAHSTGALVALLAARKLEGRVARMVFAAPFLGLAGFPLSFNAIHRLSWGMTNLGLGSRYLGGGPRPGIPPAFEGNPLTSDPARFRRNQQIVRSFPLLGLGGPTAAWVRAACDAIRAVSKPDFVSAVRTPILLVAAGNDRVVATEATEAYARKLPFGSLLTIDGARHEMLQEADRFRDQFLAAFDAFVPGGGQAEISRP